MTGDLVKPTLSVRANDVAENAWLKLGVRLIAPVIPALMALMAWLIIHEIGYVESAIDRNRVDLTAAIDSNKKSDDDGRKALWAAQQTNTTALNTLATNMSVLSQTVKTNRERSDEADQRIADSVNKLTGKVDILLQAPVPLPPSRGR